MKSMTYGRQAAFLFLLCSSFFFLGFDFEGATIPKEQILEGGPGKDGILALTDPTFQPAVENTFMQPKNRVLGFVHNGEAKAYPLRILERHEVINDVVGGKAIMVNYSPLTGSGMVFDAVDKSGERMLFGVSGMIYNSSSLFYDKKTESLWSQINRSAITGDLAGTKLNALPVKNTTWNSWRREYPETQIVSVEAGTEADYSQNPYKKYRAVPNLLFPVKHGDCSMHSKSWVLGVIVNGEVKAYPFGVLRGRRNPILRDEVGGKQLRLHFHRSSNSVDIVDESGNPMPAVQVYWFAWKAFYPETGLYLE